MKKTTARRVILDVIKGEELHSKKINISHYRNPGNGRILYSADYITKGKGLSTIIVAIRIYVFQD